MRLDVRGASQRSEAKARLQATAAYFARERRHKFYFFFCCGASRLHSRARIRLVAAVVCGEREHRIERERAMNCAIIFCRRRASFERALLVFILRTTLKIASIR